MRRAPNSLQSGSTAVEFALVLLVFLTFLLAVTDFSRMLYTWNAANEATRAGARYAAVCDTTADKPKVVAKMKAMLPQISDSNVNLVWQDELGNSCTTATCMGVTVTLTNVQYRWISPIAGLAALAPITMPTFKTFLTREIMGMDPNSPAIC